MTRKLLGTLAIVMVVPLVAFAAGCGGGDDSSTTSSEPSTTSEGGGGDSAGVKEAKAFVAEHLQPPTEIGLDTPLPAKPEAGKTIAYLECAAPVCGSVGRAVKAAGEVLGWNVTTTPTGATPEEITQAFDSVIQQKPDAVMQAGNPRALFEPQLKQLEAAGIPYIADAVAEEIGGAEIAIVSDATTYEERGEWVARWVVADTEGDANTVFFSVPDFPIVVALQKGFEAEYGKLCPDCELEVVDVPLTSIGNEFPSQVVSEVQRSPDVNYLVMGYADMTLGVPEALQGAGLNEQVDIVSQAGQPRNFENIVKGMETANVPYPDNEAGWMMVDALARHFAGVELPQDVYTAVIDQYLTAENIEDPSAQWVGVADYEDQFKRLWKVK